LSALSAKARLVRPAALSAIALLLAANAASEAAILSRNVARNHQSDDERRHGGKF
jgi:hypothetical protein